MATKRKRPEKLKCKPGYVQRGAACQKPKPKRPGSSKRKKTGILGAIAATAVIGAGATVLATRRKGQQPEPVKPPVVMPQLPDKKGLVNKQVAVIGVTGALVGAGTVAALHPKAKETIVQETAFRQADAVRLAAKIGELKETLEQKAAAEKVRQEVRKKYPTQTSDGNYKVDTDSDAVVKDLEGLFQKNRNALTKMSIDDRKRQKLLAQNQLIRYTVAMHELSKSTHPGLVVAGFRDKEGNLVGTSAGIEDPKYKALYFGGFLVSEGADKKAAIEFLKTNQEISKNMGFEGKLTGEPHEAAKPLYKRYGGRPIPGDETTWIFDGKDRKKEAWYKKHESLRGVADIIDVQADYEKEGNDRLAQHVDDLALIPPGVLNELKNRGLRDIEIKNKPVSEMNNLAHTKDVVPPGYPEGSTFETKVGGIYSFSEKVICLRGDLPAGSLSTALHETGHAVAHLMKYDSDKRLKEVHKKVYNDLPPYQQQGEPGSFLGCHEMFAESFALWIKAPKVAKRTLHPEIVKYFKEVVEPDFEKLKQGQRKDSAASNKERGYNTISVARTTIYLLKNGNLIAPKPFVIDVGKEAGLVTGEGLVEIEKGSPEHKQWTVLMN